MTLQLLTEVRVPLDLVEPLKNAVEYQGSHESVVFGLANHASLPGKTLLLLKKIIQLPDEAYIPNSSHGAAWSGRTMIPVLNEAMAGNLAVIIFHAHSHAGKVGFSRDDRQSAAALLPTFQNLVASRPHASIVLGKDHAAGMVLMPGMSGFQETVRVRYLGKRIQDLECQDFRDNAEPNDEIHHRQALLTGTTGERNIKRATVSVIGLSGGGSHVVQQLAHMGIGRIIGIDGENVDRSNLGRLIGMTSFDAMFHRKKISVMKRVVRRINRKVEFIGIPHHLPSQPAIDALKQSDIVVGCLDNYHARADLQELAWRYMIPYVHIGMLIRPDKATKQITIGGDIATLIPGGFCMWCIELLSTAKLESETGGRPRSYFEGSDKQAQVVSFNGSLASQAASEVLQLLTGYAPITTESSIKKFNGLDGTILEWGVKSRNVCATCANSLGSGDPVWHMA